MIFPRESWRGRSRRLYPFQLPDRGLHFFCEPLEAKHNISERGLLRFLHRFPYSNNGGTNLHHDTLTASDPLGWHHIRAIKDGDERKLYFDGALVATDTDTTQYDQALVPAIGRMSPHVGARYFKGYLDELEFRSGNSN